MKHAIYLPLAATLMLTLSAGTKIMAAETRVSVGPIQKEQPGSPGCVLNKAGKDWQTPPIFMDTVDEGAYMNLDGQDVKLERVNDENPEYRSQADPTLRIQVDYGKGKQHEAGMTYKKAKIRLTRNGRTQTVKAQGGCGC